jgi:methyl coenzyme M reductase beta subunit
LCRLVWSEALGGGFFSHSMRGGGGVRFVSGTYIKRCKLTPSVFPSLPCPRP